ncbi:GNAT family N-acetyltransferase [Pseudalkalibacillus caeni]|uniref:GNAT family N-acetyltransferase n=1 Tax=Exobacillus caeni TaxID=2574798 RepID=A0A5R9F0Q2_9BACL|nr:GNAT family N-acetyltransferase [Pseudalkalibacillus caeni]TLS37212.1 GNAT family N-acetyltransferase [Pseudalkalibacillus caeni]
MEIRLLNTKDAEAYWNLRLEALQKAPESFATTYREAMDRENPIERTAQNIRATGSFTLGAFVDGNLCGTVTVVKEKAAKMRHKAMLVAMYIQPEHQKKGFGKKLVQKAIERAKAEGIEQVLLSVATTNPKARKLYESVGFESIGIEKNALKHKGKYWDEEHMILFLT